jgi:[protein-PII] uridylyltransferase
MPPLLEQYKTILQESRERWFSGMTIDDQPLKRVAGFTSDVDAILIQLFNQHITETHPSLSVCLVALGGYGRGELCPYSDIDLLILHNAKEPPPAIAAAVRAFWDIGLSMGCVVRTVEECTAIVGQDIATDTAFLESRLLCGNEALYKRMLKHSVKPYFIKKQKQFIDTMRTCLRDELFSSESTLYKIEPDIKNGVCTLRDCQRLIWSEHVRVGLTSMTELAALSHFTIPQMQRFCAAYEFLIGLRCSLHMACNRRIDILETALQPEIAQRLGYGKQGAGLLMERFFKTVRDIRLFLLLYLEKSPAGTSLWTYFRKKVSAVEAAPGINVCEGIFFPGKNCPQRSAMTPVWILTVFRQALRYQATLAVELRNKIRSAVARSESEAFKTEETENLFLDILAYSGQVGHVFQLMHETGTLARLIPQFEDLTCKVEYDSYHEFTVDQHILLTLVEADKLARDPDPQLRKLYKNHVNLMLLRLALLLHDSGKALPGDHVVNGTIIAETMCERLDLSDEDSSRIKFLVYRHLELSELSFRKEPEPAVLQDFADIVEDRENLDLLYLLTILDIRSVGRTTWTSWKAFQLEHIYSNIKKILLRQTHAEQPEENDSTFSYVVSTIPEERKLFESWLAELPMNAMKLYSNEFHGFERLTVCGWDRAGFLRDIVSCISSEGYNILSAHIFSMPDGKILDIFHVESPQAPNISAAKRVKNIQKKWETLRNGQVTSDALVAERLKRYPLKQLRPVRYPGNARIAIDTTSSEHTTSIQIKAADNFGLLNTLIQILNNNNINIRSAHLSTRIDQAVDVFYITDSDGNKVTDPAVLDRLTNDIALALKD